MKTLCGYIYPDGRNCHRQERARGFCSMHDRRNRMGQPMDAPTAGEDASYCTYVSAAGKCTRKYFTQGLCRIHRSRLLSGTPMDAIIVGRPENKGTCTYVNTAGEKCNRTHRAFGYCDGHYQRFKRGMPMDPPFRERKKAEKKQCPTCGNLFQPTASAQIYCSPYCFSNKNKRLIDENGRECSRCGRYLSWANFYFTKKSASKHSSMCKDCARASRYGLRNNELHQMAESQENRCAICGKRKSLQIDHNHETGQVRGLLCTSCNVHLGGFEDNPEMLSRAISYLSSSSVTLDGVMAQLD